MHQENSAPFINNHYYSWKIKCVETVFNILLQKLIVSDSLTDIAVEKDIPNDAIDLDYSEFSGGMLFLVASGTAVKLKEWKN